MKRMSEVSKTGAKIHVLKSGVTTSKVNECLNPSGFFSQCKGLPCKHSVESSVDEKGKCGDKTSLNTAN